MMKYFAYELKKNWLVVLTFTVLSCVINLSVIVIMNGNYVLSYTSDAILVPILTLMVLCTLMPILMFRFKMDPKQADCFFALPLKREKLYLVKSAVGLILTFVPYTVAYWIGFLTVVITQSASHALNLFAFVPAYFLTLPLAVALFGINAFVFTRANRVADGVIFVALYACAGAVFVNCLNPYLPPILFPVNGISTPRLDFSFWFTYSPLTVINTRYSALIAGTHWSYNHEQYEWLVYLFAAVTGAASWFGLFFTARKEKAENADRISDSKFGYVVMIPFYLALMLGRIEFFWGSGGFAIGCVVSVACALVGYIVFRRSFKLKLADYISVACATGVGLLILFGPFLFFPA